MKKKGKQPYRCPICDGRGQVPPGFYDILPGVSTGEVHLGIDQCRTCKGAGVIWEPEDKHGLTVVPKDK